MVTDSRLLEWLSADWEIELALGSQRRTFLSLEVVANAVPSAFHERLWKTSSSLFKARENNKKSVVCNETCFFYFTYSWALVACVYPTRSTHFRTTMKVKSLQRDGTRHSLFDVDEHEWVYTRVSSKSRTVHILECSIIWSILTQGEVWYKDKWNYSDGTYHGILWTCCQQTIIKRTKIQISD